MFFLGGPWPTHPDQVLAGNSSSTNQSKSIQIMENNTSAVVAAAQPLREYAKKLGATKVEKVTGPNGAFLSFTKDGARIGTIPVGKKSQNGTLAEYKVMITDGSQGPAGQAIATVNEYSTAEEMAL